MLQVLVQERDLPDDSVHLIVVEIHEGGVPLYRRGEALQPGTEMEQQLDLRLFLLRIPDVLPGVLQYLPDTFTDKVIVGPVYLFKLLIHFILYPLYVRAVSYTHLTLPTKRIV